MFQKKIEELTLEDINKLVFVRKERENLHLEYKSDISNSNRDKKEFLKDISGFANAGGGFLIIGITENKGLPDGICGTDMEIGSQKIDEWINNVLISNLDPKIFYELKIITGIEDDKILIIIHIPESKKKPHMVTLDDRNNYFVRHNTSVNTATHIEVREMFEYSNRITKRLEQFLERKNLFDDRNPNFGLNDNITHLYNRFFQDRNLKTPFIIFSFIPRYLEDNRADVASKDLGNWITDNLKGYEPAPHVRIINQNDRIVALHGAMYPNVIYNIKDDEGDYYYWNYCELLNNGYIEIGHSNSLFYIHSNSGKPILRLTYSVAFFWLMLNFAISFYERIKYSEEIIFQLSAVNVKGIALGGFGNNEWAEPYSFNFEEPPVCRDERFKFNESFSTKEKNDDDFKNIISSFSKKISRAFGETKDKCFDKDGNIDKQKLVYLQR